MKIMHYTYHKTSLVLSLILLLTANVFLYAQEHFEYLTPLEEAPFPSDKYNMTRVVEGNNAYYYAYQTGGTNVVSSTRLQFSKTDIEGNTIFHKEILAPDGFEFYWGTNEASAPEISYAQNHISIFIMCTSTSDPNPPLFQYIFDTDGNLIHQNAFNPDIRQEYSSITHTSDGFLMASSEISANVPDYPTAIHLIKSDFDGNVQWQQQYQFVEDEFNTMAVKKIACDNNGNIYIAFSHIPSLSLDEMRGCALFKLSSTGDIIYLKRYIDITNNSGAIRNMSLSFENHELNDDLYIMSSWSTLNDTERSNFFKIDSEGQLLESMQLAGVEFGSSIVRPVSGNGCVALLGKDLNDGISNSFDTAGDPILIRFSPDFTVDWAFAYGGNDTHYSDDLIATSDGNYLIAARTADNAYVIKLDADGNSVCERTTPTIQPLTLNIETQSKEAYIIDTPFLFLDYEDCEIIDVAFYDVEENCCPYGLPVVGFEYNYSYETGLFSFTNTTSNGDSYNWNFDDGEFSYDINPEHEYMENGVYEVCLTAGNDCGILAHCETISIDNVDISEWAASAITINNSNGSLYITAAAGTEIQIYNVMGQLLAHQTHKNDKTQINNFTAGVYFCHLLKDGKIIAAKKIML